MCSLLDSWLGHRPKLIEKFSFFLIEFVYQYLFMEMLSRIYAITWEQSFWYSSIGFVKMQMVWSPIAMHIGYVCVCAFAFVCLIFIRFPFEILHLEFNIYMKCNPTLSVITMTLCQTLIIIMTRYYEIERERDKMQLLKSAEWRQLFSCK